MGWRGALRSIAAADRRAKREHARRAGELSRAYEKVDREIGSIERESERDLAKVAAAQQKIAAHPLSHGHLVYDRATGRWSFKTIADTTGKITWSMTPTMANDPVRLVGGPVVNGSRAYNAIAFAAAHWGLFIAFDIRSSDQGGKPRKLFNKTDPRRNLVYLRSGDAVVQATEGDLDQEQGQVGIVAFPVPATLAVPMAIEFNLGEERPSVRIEADDLAELIHRSTNGPDLVEDVRQKIDAELAPARQQAAKAKAKAKGSGSPGCLFWLVVTVVTVWAVYKCTAPTPPT